MPHGRREKAATRRSFRRVLRPISEPRRIVIRCTGYPAAKAEIPALAGMQHASAKAATRADNRAENSHQLY